MEDEDSLKILITKKVPQTEFSKKFAEGMYNRMATSFFKYGKVAEAYPHKIDAIASLNVRLERYKETGNTEWLMDVANFAMIEYMHPKHPKAHFFATDSEDSPGRVLDGNLTIDKNTDLKLKEK